MYIFTGAGISSEGVKQGKPTKQAIPCKARGQYLWKSETWVGTLSFFLSLVQTKMSWRTLLTICYSRQLLGINIVRL